MLPAGESGEGGSETVRGQAVLVVSHMVKGLGLLGEAAGPWSLSQPPSCVVEPLGALQSSRPSSVLAESSSAPCGPHRGL